VGQPYWGAILGMKPGETMREFFREHAKEIQYVEVEDGSALADLDTPEDYRNYRP
jgi:CTP:molybdopterin cytidylyltransferase MocA